MAEKQRIEFIDALRGFAILGVICTHVASAAGLVDGRLGKLMAFGGYGVQLFFMVSAFTIFMTYERSRAREANPLRNFFIRRLCRIVPVYWAGIALYTIVFGLGSRGWLAGPELWHYPFHATLTNIFLPSGTSSVVPGGWSISVEVMFYLTAPIWFMLVRNLRAATIFTFVWIILGTLFMREAPKVIHLDWLTEDARWVFWYRQLPSQLACFGAGMMLYYSLMTPPVVKVLRKGGVQILLALASVALLALALVEIPRVPTLYIASAAFLAVALLLSQRPLKALVNKATITIGRVSYSAYLLHFLVIEMALSIIPASPNALAKMAILLLVTLAITLPLAWVSWRWYETFWTNFAKRWIAKNELSSSPQAPRHARQLRSESE